MFCTNCGSSFENGLKFCSNCGAEVAPNDVTTNQPQPTESAPSQPLYSTPNEPIQQPVYNQPVYQTPVATIPKKKRHIGLYVLLSILILLIGTIAYMLASLFFFPPKDLGVDYTQADYNSAIQKLGIHVNANLGSNGTYDNAPIIAGNATSNPNSTISKSVMENGLSYKDYDWSFTNYQHKVVTLTDKEATAFFNEIAPPFWWFKDTQVKIEKDGTITTSSSANIKKIKEELFVDVANQIPVKLPDKVNLNTKGSFSITDNKITMTPTVFNAGPIPLPKEYKSGNNLTAFSTYLERFITVIPELKINSAKVQDGKFIFDGNIPTEVNVTPKK